MTLRCMALGMPILLVALAPQTLTAASVDPTDKYAWGGNVGWCNAHAGGAYGVVVAENVLSGYLWCENIGWVSLGDGTPATPPHYSNASASDYGVNHDGAGNLSGYAWGQNVGWLAFDTSGSGGSQVTIDAAGQFHGYAWGENIGWVSLSSGHGVHLNDADGDTIPDTWENDTDIYVDPYHTGTDPGNADSDGEGIGDGTEVALSSDPNDSGSHPSSSQVWVDFAFEALELGTLAAPFNTLAEAVIVVISGGSVKVKGDTAKNATAETPRITKAMRVEAVGGPARIGDLAAQALAASLRGAVVAKGVESSPYRPPAAADIRLLIEHLYLNVLAREPDEEEIKDWCDYFRLTLDLRIDVRFVPREMANFFFASEDYASRDRSDREFILDCYRTFLLREPDAEDLKGWSPEAWSRALEVARLAESEEFDELVTGLFPDIDGEPERNLAARVHLCMLGRLPAFEEMDRLARLSITSADEAASTKQTVQDLLASEEFLERAPTNRDRVVRLYRACTGRQPDVVEVDWWVEEFESGRQTLTEMLGTLAIGIAVPPAGP